jgi:DNA-binding CsgD family transcriptional regulator
MNELPLYVQKMDSLNQVILDLYSEELQGTEKYIQFLKNLQGILYFDFGNVVFFINTGNGYDLESFCQIGWDRHIEKIYLSTYYKDDDVFPIFEKKTPVVMRSSDMFDETRTMSEYYKSFMQSAGFDRSLECNIILPENINSYGICSLFRRVPKQDFNYEDKKIFEFIQPHLSNQAGLSRTREGASVETGSNLSGTLILKQNGDILHIDENFKKILLKYNKHSSLKESTEEIFGAAKGVDCNDSTGLLYRSDNIPGLIEIIGSLGKENRECAYYCKLYDLAGIMDGCLKMIERVYHLTSAEMTILEHIIQGKPREEIAKKCYTSIPSVKKHIASIYRKMNITNQMQLLAHLGITKPSDNSNQATR